jgi:hypothetical protein
VAMGRGAISVGVLLAIVWLLVAATWLAFGNQGHPSAGGMALMLAGPLTAVLAPIGVVLGAVSLSVSRPITGSLRRAVILCGRIAAGLLVLGAAVSIALLVVAR